MGIQFSVFFLFPNSRLSGEGRILSLNMLDAYSTCQTQLLIKLKNETIEYYPINNFSVRIQCDPLVTLRQAELTCENFLKQKNFIDIDMSLQISDQSQKNLTLQYSFSDICSKKLRISFLGKISQDE